MFCMKRDVKGFKDKLVSTVADEPRDALCPLKFYQLAASWDSFATDGMCDVRVTINGRV